ncbi:MAG: hypothetical protein MPW15_16850 [Candidatus Manganitrophus sp.]|nr:hypothetical protein [Candidatus Manganitrophus sp.]
MEIAEDPPFPLHVEVLRIVLRLRFVEELQEAEDMVIEEFFDGEEPFYLVGGIGFLRGVSQFL